MIDKAIIAEQAETVSHAQLGVGGEVPNKVKPAIYSFGLTVIGEKAVVPPDVKTGKHGGHWRDGAGGIIRMACLQAERS